MARTRRGHSSNGTASGSGSNVVVPQAATAAGATRRGSRKPRYQDMLLVAMSSLKKTRFSRDELFQTTRRVAQKLSRSTPLRDYYLLDILKNLLLHNYLEGNQDASDLQVTESLRNIIENIFHEVEGTYITREVHDAHAEHCELFRHRIGVLKRHSAAELRSLLIEVRARTWRRQGSRESSRASSPLTDLDAMEEDCEIEIARGNEMQVDDFEDLAPMAGPSNLQISPVRRGLSPIPCAAYPTPDSMPNRRINRIPTASPPSSPTPLARQSTGNHSMFFRRCMEEKDEELCTLRQSNRIYQEDLARRNEELGRFREDLAAKDEQITNCETLLLEKDQQLAASRQDILSYKQQILDLTETIAELQSEVDDQVAQIGQNAEDKRALQERESNAREEIEVLREQLRQCAEEIRQQEEIRTQIARLSGPRDVTFLTRMNL